MIIGPDNVSRIFQDPAKQRFADGEDPAEGNPQKSLTEERLESWYRYRVTRKVAP
jgi:hypothetical protein